MKRKAGENGHRRELWKSKRKRDREGIIAVNRTASVIHSQNKYGTFFCIHRHKFWAQLTKIVTAQTGTVRPLNNAKKVLTINGVNCLTENSKVTGKIRKRNHQPWVNPTTERVKHWQPDKSHFILMLPNVINLYTEVFLVQKHCWFLPCF